MDSLHRFLSYVRSFPEAQRKMMGVGLFFIAGSVVVVSTYTAIVANLPGIVEPKHITSNQPSTVAELPKEALSPIAGIIESLKGVKDLFIEE